MPHTLTVVGKAVGHGYDRDDNNSVYVENFGRL